jgi:hypothetical protein
MISADKIAAAILMHVRRAAGRRKKPIVTREFTLGQSAVRADLALLGDEFIGIEIKGLRDNLKRFPAQMAAYSRFFNKTIAVVDNRHLRHIRDDTLCGAALWSFDINGELKEVKVGGPAHEIETKAYLETMTQQEKKRYVRPKTLEDDIPVIFRQVFESRYGPTSSQFWASVSRRRIHDDDLSMLSRFSEARLVSQRHSEERKNFWQQWAAELEEGAD